MSRSIFSPVIFGPKSFSASALIILESSFEIFEEDSIFRLKVPTSLKNVDNSILFPRNVWTEKELYDIQAIKLAKLFINNFKNYVKDQTELIDAGPKID